jgi:hypothetical protein
MRAAASGGFVQWDRLMHVHLPKPLHGWRAFVGEVGIIVVGVLIALGAEQVVEGMHWRQTVETERKALDGDVADMWNAMSGRVIIEHCVDQRLAEIKLVLDRHKDRQPLGIFGPVGRPGVWTASANALQMASADQSLSHMSFADAPIKTLSTATALSRRILFSARPGSG